MLPIAKYRLYHQIIIDTTCNHYLLITNMHFEFHSLPVSRLQANVCSRGPFGKIFEWRIIV